MKRPTKDKNLFLNGYFITSVGTIMITVLTAHYISLKTTTYKEIPYDTPISDSTFYGFTSRPGWHVIDVGAFLVESPKTFLYTKLRGIDSKVGEIGNQTDAIVFDYGLHSYGFDNEITNSDFDSWTVRINKRLFTIVRRKEGAGTIGAYTTDLADGHRLNIVCVDCNNPDGALEIFKTIKFRE
jgi:hypothetical protein